MSINMSGLDDKHIMSDSLFSQKSLAKYYDDSVLEAATPEVRQSLIQIHTEEREAAHRVWQEMNRHGWYNVSPAPENEVNKVQNMISKTQPGGISQVHETQYGGQYWGMTGGPSTGPMAQGNWPGQTNVPGQGHWSQPGGANWNAPKATYGQTVNYGYSGPQAGGYAATSQWPSQPTNLGGYGYRGYQSGMGQVGYRAQTTATTTGYHAGAGNVGGWGHAGNVGYQGRAMNVGHQGNIGGAGYRSNVGGAGRQGNVSATGRQGNIGGGAAFQGNIGDVGYQGGMRSTGYQAGGTPGMSTGTGYGGGTGFGGGTGYQAGGTPGMSTGTGSAGGYRSGVGYTGRGGTGTTPQKWYGPGEGGQGGRTF